MESYQQSKKALAPDNLVELAILHANEAGSDIAYRFPYTEPGDVELSYVQIDAEARRIAAYLQTEKLTNAPVVLLLPTGAEFVKAFFACLYANVPAVPVAAPRNITQLKGLQRILYKCASRTIITDGQFLDKLMRHKDFAAHMPDAHWVLLETIATTSQDWKPVGTDRNDVAFLQFTSGSTGNPKGVVVTHQNIIHNQKMIEQGFRHSHDAVVVGWLPLFHDMGLVGNMLNPFYMRRPCLLMAPEQFLRKPRIWLETISYYSATTSGGPNFAYEMCVQRIDDNIDDLDLSNWRVAYVGAEPVREATLQRFAKKFASTGFKANAFYPCYGLAEATLIVTGVDRDAIGWEKTLTSEVPEKINKHQSESQDTVACGVALGGQQVVVVNPEKRELCLDGVQGEVWISGSSVAAGYYDDPEVTEQVFSAYLTSGEGPFLRTGDMGVWLDGQLVLRGRIKDMIIVSGVNIFAEDIEVWLNDCDSNVMPGSITAFPLSIDQQETLAIAAEVRRDCRRDLDGEVVANNLRAVLAQHIDVPVAVIVLCNIGSIPRTTSGKVQHWRCSQLFAQSTEGTLHRSEIKTQQAVLADDESITVNAQKLSQPVVAVEVIAWLCSRIAHKTKQSASAISTTTSFAHIGITSADALEITVELGKALDRSLEDTLFWEYPCINEVASFVAGQ